MADIAAVVGGAPVHGARYPVRTKTVTGAVNGIATEAEVTYFRDKVLVLVSQGGRLAQWIQVPLSAPSAASVDAALPAGLRAGGGVTGLLPSTHLTPRTLFGAGSPTRETFGQLVAAQIGSLLALRDTSDVRTLVVGLGLEWSARLGGVDDAQAQQTYFDVVDLVQKAM